MKVKNSRILVLPYTYMYCTVLYIWMEQMVTSSLPKKVSVDFLKVKSTVHQTKLRQCQNNLSQSFYKNYFFVFILRLVIKYVYHNICPTLFFILFCEIVFFHSDWLPVLILSLSRIRTEQWLQLVVWLCALIGSGGGKLY